MRIRKGAEEDMDMVMHVTNPRFGLAHNDSGEVLYPTSVLAEDMRTNAHAVQGTSGERWEAVKRRVSKAMLQVACIAALFPRYSAVIRFVCAANRSCLR